ncbi:Superoxide dismutase [Balamuthia mandrillaris]
MFSTGLRTVARPAASSLLLRPLGNRASASALLMSSSSRRSLFTLEEPPYLQSGLGSAISAKQLDFHFNKHHKTYLNKTNEAVQGTPDEYRSLEDVILSAKASGNAGLFNNSAQLWNHSFFWKCMAEPGKTGEMSNELQQRLKDAFGSVEEFKKKFTQAATTNFGSGWTWLVDVNGKLEIMNTSNAESPVVMRVKPLLTLDVWEHAYYIDHQNRRPDYITKWWDVVNWNFVNAQLSK